MKYLIAKLDGLEQAILFATTISHQTIAKSLPADAIVAGGFAIVRGAKADHGDGKSLSVFCWGESMSVGVKSRLDKDEVLVQMAMNWPDA